MTDQPRTRKQEMPTTPRRSARPRAAVAALLATAVLLTSCSRASSPDPATATTSRGPITVWMSSNEQELSWGRKMGDDWNAAHPDQKVTVLPIPSGATSEGVLRAAITAGNAPCLVYNIAPSAEPDFERQGGLVPIDSMPGGRSYIEERTGAVADQFTSADGKFYQFPWKSNPVQLFYNKSALDKAGVDPSSLDSYAGLLSAARKIKKSGAAKYALWPSVGSEYYAPWSDFYPFYVAATGKQLVGDQGQPNFDSPAGRAVAKLYQTFYNERLAPRESAPEGIDPFVTGDAAFAVAGPWAIASYGDKVDWGTTAVPAPEATDKPNPTYGDSKNVGLMTACANRATAWDFLKSTTSKDADGALLKGTGQMPLRQKLQRNYPKYFADHRAYADFAAAVPRAVDSPQVKNSIQIWQTFRDAWTNSVIYHNESVRQAFAGAGSKVHDLATRK